MRDGSVLDFTLFLCPLPLHFMHVTTLHKNKTISSQILSHLPSVCMFDHISTNFMHGTTHTKIVRNLDALVYLPSSLHQYNL